MFVSDIRQDGYKGLAYKYGAAVIVMILNYLVFAYVFSYTMLVPGISFIENVFGSDAADQKYAFVIFMNAVMSYLVPIVVFALMFRRDMPEKDGILPFRTEGEYKRFPGETAMLFVCGIWAAMAGGYVTSFISELLNRLFEVPETTVAFSGMMPQNAAQFIAFEVGSVIIAPVCEELIYRHFLLKPLRKYGDTGAVVLTALLFGLVHFNFDQFLYAFMFGAFLALIAVRSGSVIPCIICHMINNLMVGIRTYLPETLGDAGVDAVFAAAAEVIGIIQLVVFFAGAFVLIAAILLKLLRLKSPAGISAGKQLSVVFTNPIIILGIITALVVSFINLY